MVIAEVDLEVARLGELYRDNASDILPLTVRAYHADHSIWPDFLDIISHLQRSIVLKDIIFRHRCHTFAQYLRGRHNNQTLLAKLLIVGVVAASEDLAVARVRLRYRNFLYDVVFIAIRASQADQSDLSALTACTLLSKIFRHVLIFLVHPLKRLIGFLSTNMPKHQ